MTIKIQLPKELRARIQSFLSDIDDAVKAAPENRTQISDGISRLQGEAARLDDEICSLKLAAVENDNAAVTLNTKVTRHAQITERLVSLRSDLENLRPVTLSGAGEIIADVTRFYVANLPDAIADFFTQSNLCPTRHKALIAAKQLDCVTVLQPLRNWSLTVGSQTATPDVVERLRNILTRALRGQAHLGADLPVNGAEVAP